MSTAMVQDLNEEIHQFNQQALKQELTAALIIHNQFVAITEDIGGNYHSDQTQELQKRILDIAGQSIKSLLHTDSKEVFIMHQDRLIHLLTNIKEKLALEGDFDQALEDYRFFHHIHRVLRNATLKTSKDLLDNLPLWFKKHPYYKNWQEKLVGLAAQEKASAFEAYKKGLIEELLIKESYQDLANLASLALIEKICVCWLICDCLIWRKQTIEKNFYRSGMDGIRCFIGCCCNNFRSRFPPINNTWLCSRHGCSGLWSDRFCQGEYQSLF
ncbi:hypothetical protein [Legionella tunisiensis]|uniref:hypothetical protein n=1 Tax=Legionella tunisiensis TaxID=1034944 RepID=UPI001E5E6FA6|nr:hypothetical protein [Legionella tunisiensis]